MKKFLLTLVLGLFISITTIAQSNSEKRAANGTKKSIANIEKTIKLSDAEKETYAELNNAYLLNHFELQEMKKSDPAAFKKGIKANKADYIEKLTNSLGKERTDEILAALKANKGKKGKKGKKNKKK